MATAVHDPAPHPHPNVTAAGSARRHRRRRGDLLPALLFVAPALMGFLVFYVWPALRGVYYSFTDFSVLSPPEWVGTANYERLVGDPLVWNAFKVTGLYVLINIGVQTVLALGLAVLMHRLTKSMVIRGALLMPYLVANVVVALAWFWMLDYQIGIVNEMLAWAGVDRVAFFGSAWAIPTIALINVWRHLGYTALLLFAGLQTIPPQLYEAAAIDGSGEVRSFFRITLPLLRPVLAMVLVVTVTGSFQIFDTVAVTTAGGPVNATRVVYFYIYELAFGGRFEFGYASAISVVLFLVLSVVALLQIKMLRAGESDMS